MKLAELKSISEHERGRHDDAFSTAELLKFLEDAEQLKQGIRGGDMTIVMFLHRASSAQHIIVLTTRTDQAVPVGYVMLQHDGRYWEVQSVKLNQELRGMGVATNLYRTLAVDGYKLRSGMILSPEAEKIWQRLGQLKLVKVLDTETGELEDFSDKPIGDGDLLQGQLPRHYWVMEMKTGCTIYHRSSDTRHLAENMESWLRGDTPGQNNHIVAMGCLSVEAEE